MPVEEEDAGSECSEESDLEVTNGHGVPGRLSALLPRKLFGDDAAVRKGLLQVFVRVKPVARKLARCMAIEKEGLVKATWKNKEALYKFSKVFPEDTAQQAIYSGVAEGMVTDLLSAQQKEAVIMAYGVTSAGKTFTMQGTADKPGIVPQALEHLFRQLPSAAGPSSGGANGGCGSGSVRVLVSAYEIYNEVVYDLLALASTTAGPACAAASAARPALRLKEAQGHITVVGAVEAEVKSAKEALDLLRRAGRARQSAGTRINQHSSRSHAVFTVKLLRCAAPCGDDDDSGGDSEQQARAGAAAAGRGGSEAPCTKASQVQVQAQAPEAQGQASYLHFVDLAGCERVARTGNSGARLRESVAINSSLMTLARCLEVLRYNQMHTADQKVIPYRESKITHMFKAILTGHGRFVLLVNVSPAVEEFNETKRVLEYAALASKIKMTSNLAPQPDPAASAAVAAIAAEAAEEHAALAAQVASLQARLAASQGRVEELLDEKADLEYDLDVMDRKVELLREELVRAEVEKEGIEAEVRAEVMADVAQLVKDAAAKARDEAVKARDDAARAQEERDAARDEAARAAGEAAAALEAAAAARGEAEQLGLEAERLRKKLDAQARAAARMEEELQREVALAKAAQADVASARADAQGKAKVISGLEAKLAAQLANHEALVRSLQQQLAATAAAKQQAAPDAEAAGHMDEAGGRSSRHGRRGRAEEQMQEQRQEPEQSRQQHDNGEQQPLSTEQQPEQQQQTQAYQLVGQGTDSHQPTSRGAQRRRKTMAAGLLGAAASGACAASGGGDAGDGGDAGSGAPSSRGTSGGGRRRSVAPRVAFAAAPVSSLAAVAEEQAEPPSSEDAAAAEDAPKGMRTEAVPPAQEAPAAAQRGRRRRATLAAGALGTGNSPGAGEPAAAAGDMPAPPAPAQAPLATAEERGPSGSVARAGGSKRKRLSASGATRGTPGSLPAVAEEEGDSEEGTENTAAAELRPQRGGANAQQAVAAAAAAAAAPKQAREVAAAGGEPGGKHAAQPPEEWRPAADVLRELSDVQRRHGAAATRATGRRATIAAGPAAPAGCGGKGGRAGEAAAAAAAAAGRVAKRRRCSWGAEGGVAGAKAAGGVAATPVALRTRRRPTKA